MQDALFRAWGPDVKRIKVSPFGDIHVGAPYFREDLFDAFVEEVLADPHWFLVGIGDFGDFVMKSSVGSVFEQTLTPQQQRKWLKTKLWPLRDRILALMEGNHDERSAKDTGISMAQLVAADLELENLYQPDGAVMILQFGRAEDHGTQRGRPKPQTYTGYATHGRTGGRLPGAKIIAVDRLGQFAHTDFVMMGHVHDKMSRKIRMLDVEVRSRKPRLREQAQIIAGSFLDFGGYAQKFAYQPGALGMPTLILDGTKHDMEIVI